MFLGLAMVFYLSQSGYEQEAILLFCQKHTLGMPAPYIFSSVLSSYTKIVFFFFLDKFWRAAPWSLF